MKKMIFCTLLFISLLSAYAQERKMPEEYIPFNLAAGFNPDFKFAIDLDSKERGRKIAESLPKFELPKPKETFDARSSLRRQGRTRRGKSDFAGSKVASPPAAIPKDLTGDDDLISGSEDLLKKAENSNDESLKQAAWDNRIDKARRESAGKIKYLNRTFIKEDWQDRYLKGKFGLDPNLSEEENRKKYEDLGYSYSTTMPDKEIYTYCGIAMILIFSIASYLYKRKSFVAVK